MDTKKFKEIFKKFALENGFQKMDSWFFIQSPISIVLLELQKSNYSRLYYLNMNVYIQGYKGHQYKVDSKLIKNFTNPIFLRPSQKCQEVFTLDNTIEDQERERQLQIYFENYLIPLVTQMLSKEGIKAFYDDPSYRNKTPEHRKNIFLALGYEDGELVA